MQPSDLKRLRELEQENVRFKWMYADLSLDNPMLKELVEKKVLSVDERRKAVVYLKQKFNASEKRACHIVCISLSDYRYQAKTQYDKEISDILRTLVQSHPANRETYWMIILNNLSSNYIFLNN